MTVSTVSDLRFASRDIPAPQTRASPVIGREPITLKMRALHRAALHWPVKPHRLRNERPLVSVTFDDVPASAVDTGAKLLEDEGVRGTFYVATSLLGHSTCDWHVATETEVATLAEHGHELALHSHAHRPTAGYGPAGFGKDLGEVRRRLRELAPGATFENYAFPFGFSSPLVRRVLAQDLRSSRTARPGLNLETTDLHHLRSHHMGSTLHRPEEIDGLLDDAAARRGWLILTTHDVRADPSPYGCTPALLKHVVEGAARRGMDVLTVTEALDRCGAPRVH